MAAIFPGAVATQLQLLTAINNTKVTLNADAGIGDTTVTVDDPSPLPASGYLTFDDHETNPETIFYTGISAPNLTGVTRGADGTSAGAHTTGAHLEQRYNAAYHNINTLELVAVEQYLSDRFGIGSSPVVPSSKTLTLAAGTNQLVLGTTRTVTVTAPIPASASRTWTIPDLAGDMTFAALGGTQTFSGSKTFSASVTLAGAVSSVTVTISATTNQLILGTTNTVTITSPAPASSAVYTIPDVGVTASFVMNAGTQTIAGAKTFSSAPVFSSLTLSTVPYLDASKILTSSAVTPTELGYLSGVTSAIQTQIAGLSPAPANILDNGGFEIWQRGVTFTAPASAAYTADRWKLNTDEATNVTTTKETTTIDAIGLASMKVVVTSTGASHYYQQIQYIENYADYRGKTVTLSVRVFASVASAIKIQVGDNASNTTSAYHTGGGGWETLTATFTVGAAASQLNVVVGMINSGDKKNGTYYFDSAMLGVASAAVPFAPTNPQVDLARCQRFFQILGGNITTEWLLAGMPISTADAIFPLRFIVKMRVAPTMTVNNATNFSIRIANNSDVSCTAVTSSGLTQDNCYIDGSVTAGIVAGQSVLFHTSNTNAIIYLSADL
jgi:hypothetical protein